MRRMRPIALFALAALVGTAAVASGSGPNLKSMVLGLSDMPPGFEQDYSHSVSKAEAIRKQNYVTPGYVEGWEAQFTRTEGFRTAVVGSSVSRYRSPALAHTSALDSFKRAIKPPPGFTNFRRISVGALLGNEARAYSFEGKAGVTLYVILWRYHELKAFIFLGGLPSIGATAQQATRLAVKQQAHMKAAQ